MSADEVSRLIEVWVHEVGNAGEGEEDEKSMQIMQEAWDDVNAGELPIGEVKAARGEEIGYMVKGNMQPGAHGDELAINTEGPSFSKVG